jgi:hypothetical protein
MFFLEFTLLKVDKRRNRKTPVLLPGSTIELADNCPDRSIVLQESQYRSLMCPIEDIFRYAVKTDVNGKLYYDFNAHSYHRLRTLSSSDPTLQQAIDDKVEVARHYGQCYLVPVEAVHRARGKKGK